MLSALSLALTFGLLIYFLIKKPGYILCYIILFTSLNGLLLAQIGATHFRFIIGIFFIALFLVFYLKPKILKKRFKQLVGDKMLWGVILIPIYMVAYIFIIGGISVDGTDYSFHFIAATIQYFIFAILFIQTQRYYNEFIDGIIIWGLLYFIAIFLLVDLSSFDLLDRSTLRTTERFNAITLGRFAGIIFIVSLMCLLFDKKSPLLRTISLIVIIISAYWIFATSTRQIFIGIVLSFSIFYLLRFSVNLKSIFQLSIIIIIVAVIVSIMDISQFLVLERFHELENLHDIPRYYDYIVTMSIFNENMIFGIGPHGYQDLMGRYPHSFLLEMIASFGIMGLIAFSLVSISGFYYAIKIFRMNHFNYRFNITAILWIYYFITVAISGDLNINRHFWILSGVIIVSYYLAKNHVINLEKHDPRTINTCNI